MRRVRWRVRWREWRVVGKVDCGYDYALLLMSLIC